MPMPMHDAPELDIHIDALLHNLHEIRRACNGDNGVMAVVKDCAYGLGAIPIARALEREGVDWFAVARTAEARDLRSRGIMQPVLILGEASDEDLAWGYNQKIDFALNSITSLRRVLAAQKQMRAHLNINTGMNRMGVDLSEVVEIIDLFKANPRISLTGLFTHFASADVPETTSIARQHACFTDAIEVLQDNEFEPQTVHLANSAAALRHSADFGAMIRPGIALYGCNPDPRQDFGVSLESAVTLKAPVVRIDNVSAGTPIGYGGTYVTGNDTGIATIAAGYAHGIPRLLSNKGSVLIEGRRYPIAGRVSMDFIMADIGPGNNISPGAEAVIIGRQLNECIPVDHIAALCKTIGYEILCGLSTTMHRRYLEGDRVVSEISPSFF
ncbi:MAG: alanine racemase [Chitinivibrionales bacterium]|nr:alanine racemase [Chitinivibrionales bacterium]